MSCLKRARLALSCDSMAGIFGYREVDFILALVKSGAEDGPVEINCREWGKVNRISPNTINRWLIALEDAGYVIRAEHGKGRPGKVMLSKSAKEDLDEVRDALGVRYGD